MATSAPTPDYARRTLQGTPRRIVRGLLLGLCRLVIRMRVEGAEKVPQTGGIIVIANHLHNADPILTSIACPRSVHYMAKKEIFKTGIVRFLLKPFGTFPVDRGKSDRTAIRGAQQRLAQGIAIGIFPEGTRSKTRSLKAAFPGAGLLALSPDTVVVPIAVTGTERLPFNGGRGKDQAAFEMPDPGHKGVRLRIGDPFRIPRQIGDQRIGSDEAAEIMMIELARILPPDYRGIYADKLAQETTRRAQPV